MSGTPYRGIVQERARLAGELTQSHEGPGQTEYPREQADSQPGMSVAPLLPGGMSERRAGGLRSIRSAVGDSSGTSAHCPLTLSAQFKRVLGWADAELGDHLQAANLDKGSTDVPIEQEREL